MSPFAHSNGIDLWYETFGRASDAAVLLIAGLGGQTVDWGTEFCSMLADRGFFVVRFDNRDAGLSTSFDEYIPDIDAALRGDFSSVPYALEDLCEDTVGLMDALDIESAHVAGVSMGGMVAQLLTLRHPERVLSLTSIMSNTGEHGVGRPSEQGMKRLLRRSPTDATREEIIDLTLDSRRVTSSSAFPFDEEYERERVAIAYDRSTSRLGRARHMIAVGKAQDRTSELKNICVPTLVIHGNEDQVVDVSGGEATARAIPNARLMIIEGLAHELPKGAWPVIIDGVVSNAARSRPS